MDARDILLHHSGGVPGDPIALWKIKGGVLQPDSVGLLITRDQVDPVLVDIFFDGETRRDDADIAALAFASPLLNFGTAFGREGVVVAAYSLDTSASILNRASRAVRSAIKGYQIQTGEIFQFQDGSPVEF
jgi:hypothetical protein